MSESGVGRDRHAMLVLAFAVYLAALVWVVLWKMQPPHVGGVFERQLKLVPFVASGGFGSSNPREVIANVLIFAPFGIYLALLRPRWTVWRSATVVAGASLALEVGQFVLAVGSSDVSDLIANTAGGVVGIALLALGRWAIGPPQRARSAAAP